MDVSIIIPTYNRLWSLPKAINSCFETNLNIEVLVVNDGSNDGTDEWLNARTDIVVFHQKNQGKDWAVNHAFQHATGKYIRFLDSDDWLLPYSTDLLFKEAELKNADVVAAGHEVYSEDELLLKTINWQICDDFIAQQLGECDSSHYSAYLFKREFINNIPHRQEFGARDDRQFIIEVALKKPEVAFVTIPTLAHRAHGNERLQSSSALNDQLNNIASLKIYKQAIAELGKTGDLTERRKKAAIRMLWPLAHWTAKNDIKQGTAIYNWIKKLDPSFKIPDKGAIGFAYRNLGFSLAEKLFKLRRIILPNRN